MLSLFGDDPESQEPETQSEPPMTDLQRGSIRELFRHLGIADAKSQFESVRDFTGHSISSVQDLSRERANTLLKQLEARASMTKNASTGNAWADRTEDTWLDKL
jgi:hypothetical protein